MTDVFISYKKEDAGRVIRLVEALRAEGLSVWWDHGIRAGAEWDKSIHEELYAAKVVIAIWSESSVKAPWVKEEATVGKNRGVLLPAKIDEVEPPLGFMMIQAANLVGWKGDRKDPRWAAFLEAVHAILHGEARILADAPLRRPQRKVGLAFPLAGVGVLTAAAVAFGVWTLMQREPVVPPPAPVVALPPAALPAPAAKPEAPPLPTITDNEQKLWDRAVGDKTRQGFQTYLLSYPNGAYAQRARDTLLTCRTETQDNWKPGPDVANQMVRGVSGGPLSAGISAEQHCAKAKSDVRALAKLMCEAITTNGGYRNAKWTIADAPCDCQRPNDRVMTCIADLAYSCRWEMKVTEHIEICG
jgi:hypothetical protein